MSNVQTITAATDKQVAFAKKLAAERPTWDSVLNGAEWERTFDLVADGSKFVSKTEASAVIDALLAIKPAPVAKAAPVARPAVDSGRYAVEQDGVLKFYKVSAPTEGRWAGYVFLDVYASDETWPIKNRSAREAVLAAIALDPQAAMLRYGQEIGACGHCGRTLTDETSRARGIGPVCAGKVGW